MLNIKTDSRKVKTGDTFVAIKGFTVDGYDFIEEAILKGAKKIICDYSEYTEKYDITNNLAKKYDVEFEPVDDTKKWIQNYIVSNYKDKANKLKIIGITGTNGKTTSCFLTYQMLKNLGVKVAYMGTIGFFCGEETVELPNTVPEILDLYTLLLEALEKGCTHVVMEVSSHALAEKRVEGLEFTAAAFTNLTEDHLDFHKTMENYSMTKALILQQLKDDGSVIVNNDDEYADIFKKKNYITIGFKDSNFTILSYQYAQNATVINFKYKDTEYIVSTGLRCRYNIYNYMTALAILVNLGYDINKILTISQNLTTPKGRCQLISVKDALAVVDYAHTPDAVDKIISAFSENKKGKIITIVGCGGDRDSMKRAIMGKIASEKSDYVIFTSDNPRTENPQKILADIVQGVKQSNYQVEADRVKAIEKGLDLLERDDVLLILGKGHENYQIIGNTKYHLDDAEEVEKYIDSKNRA